jgi:hypothetical protein
MDTNIIKDMLGRNQGMSSSIEKTSRNIKTLFFIGDKGMLGKCQWSMVALHNTM